MALSIHPAATIEDCRAVEQLQAEIWGGDLVEVTPDHLLITLVKEGGQVLLARDEAGTAVGFAYGFLGMTEDNRLKLASHQVGVHPAYQNRGIGYELKLAQRQAALERGLALITWTFDPLQMRNAHLNLNKLGAVANTYIPNLYGYMRDDLNRNLPSDRFRVDWWLVAAHVVRRLAGQPAESEPLPDGPVLNRATNAGAGLLAPADSFALPEEPVCLVEVPRDLEPYKVQAPDLALAWRRHTGQLFERIFELGYTAVALLRREERNYYLLQRDWKPFDQVGPLL